MNERIKKLAEQRVKQIAEELCSVQPMPNNIMKELYDSAKDKRWLEENGYEPVSNHGILWVKKMNEQIKKLWDQSKTSGVHPQFGEYDMYSAETFANLIVQECAEFARQHNLEHAERSHMIHKAIKEHFGVTE